MSPDLSVPYRTLESGGINYQHQSLPDLTPPRCVLEDTYAAYLHQGYPGYAPQGGFAQGMADMANTQGPNDYGYFSGSTPIQTLETHAEFPYSDSVADIQDRWDSQQGSTSAESFAPVYEDNTATQVSTTGSTPPALSVGNIRSSEPSVHGSDRRNPKKKKNADPCLACRIVQGKVCMRVYDHG